VIEEILPPEVASAEAFEDATDVVLFPEEEAAVAKAAPRRRREFATARVCARAALAKLGLPPAPIVPGHRGAPQWPVGVLGSITHCAGYRASAAARTADVLALGLDAEPHEGLPDGVLDHVAVAEERPRLAALAAAAPRVSWDRVLFSAKETVYKAWFPLTQRCIRFEDSSISIDQMGGTFTARLLVPGAPYDGGLLAGFTGRWLVRDGLILTSIVVPRR
jgi:enterobactin synthetase component D / holo-[acyl-carrier protein] synthase